jgi:hypothetical protein
MSDDFRYDEILSVAATVAGGIASHWPLGKCQTDQAGAIVELANISVAVAAAVVTRAKALTEPARE